MRKYGEVWGRYGRMFEVGVEVVGNWGEVFLGEEKCVESCGGVHTLFYNSSHPHTLPISLSTHPTPLPHTHLTRLSTLSPPTSHLPHFPTPFLTPSLNYLPHTPLPHPSDSSLNTSPHSWPTLPHNSHTSSNTSLYSPYFVINPIPKFPTFLIYCQISLTIK